MRPTPICRGCSVEQLPAWCSARLVVTSAARMPTITSTRAQAAMSLGSQDRHTSTKSPAGRRKCVMPGTHAARHGVVFLATNDFPSTCCRWRSRGVSFHRWRVGRQALGAIRLGCREGPHGSRRCQPARAQHGTPRGRRSSAGRRAVSSSSSTQEQALCATIANPVPRVW